MKDNHENKSIFAKNMVKARRRRALYQWEAAKKIGIKRSTLGAYEEDRSEPSLETQIKICKAYRIKDWIDFISNPEYFKETSAIHR